MASVIYITLAERAAKYVNEDNVDGAADLLEDFVMERFEEMKNEMKKEINSVGSKIQEITAAAIRKDLDAINKIEFKDQESEPDSTL